MLQTEFVRNLNCNYERVFLDKNPEEKRYQYCIVTKGGIRGLLPCSLRYINNQAFLYYDISSTQNVAQLYSVKKIGRQWLKDFLWGMSRIQHQMERFLLDDKNILWYPQQVYQDLEKNEFYFLYVPYYEGENGFQELLDYLVEHIDYTDDVLVECVFKMHEQFRNLGEAYLHEQIFEDGKKLDVTEEVIVRKEEVSIEQRDLREVVSEPEQAGEIYAKEGKDGKKGILYFLDGRRKKQKDEREHMQMQMEKVMLGSAVCEEPVYVNTGQGNVMDHTEREKELGRTMYMESPKNRTEDVQGLYSENDVLLKQIDRQTIILGKKKDEVDLILEDASVSRMHARITRTKEEIYVEDLNSTNGTYKNGLRLQPYEKRRLEKGDEIRLGKVILFFK